MALHSNTLNTTAAIVADTQTNTLENHNKRIVSKYDINCTFGYITAAPLLAVCYPVGFNSTLNKYAPWMAPDPTKITIVSSTGGTWGLSVNGVAIANTVFAYNASAALVAETIRQVLGYEVTVTWTSGTKTYVITFDDDRELANLPTVLGDVTQISGGGASQTPDAGTASYGTHKIVGFVNPNDIQIHATEDIMGIVCVEGEIFYEDIVALIDSGDETALIAALKDGLVEKGLIIQNLAGIH